MPGCTAKIGPASRPGEAGKRGAEAEHDGVEQADVDAQRRHHGAVAGAGPDQHAQAGARDHEPQQHRDREADPDDHQPVERIAQVAGDLHMARQVVRDGAVDRCSAPQDRDQFVEEQDQAEGGEHLVEVVPLVERAQGNQLHHDPHHQRAGEAKRNRQRERSGGLVEPGRQVGADHVERAVGEVDEVHDAEHQRQAGGQQEQHDPELEPVERLFGDEDEVHQ